MELSQRLFAFLREKKAKYQTVEHAAAHNTSEVANLRGTELKMGGKSVLFKNKNGFHLFRRVGGA